MSIDRTKSRFFCDSSDSESDSEDSNVVRTAEKVDHSKRFSEYVKDPASFDNIFTKHKNKDGPTTRYVTYLKDSSEPYEPFSPTDLTQSYIKDMDVSSDEFFRDNNAVVSEYVSRVEAAPDSPTRKLKGNRVNQALDLFALKLSAASRDTAAYHREALANPYLDSILGAIKSLKKTQVTHHLLTPSSFVPIINLAHITQGEQAGNITRGYHYNVQHAMNVRLRARNPYNNVTCGVFRLRDDHIEKFSTFFPSSVNSEDALVRIIQRAEKLAQKDNRLLFRCNDLPIYIEKLFQEEGCVIQSAYPLFYYGDFQPNQTYQITESATLTSDEIMDRLSNPQTVLEHTRYVINEEVIVDIAPLFVDRTNGVEYGIDFRFPRNLWPLAALA